MWALRLSLLLSGSAALHACAPVHGPRTEPGTGRTLVVCGIDRSGSIRLRDQAIERCGEMLDSITRGRIQVRWVSGSSYRLEEVILDVKLSGPAPCTNPYAPRCRVRRATAVQADRALRDSALAVLRSASAPPAQSTDITGFLAAAADWLNAAGPADRKVLAIASDLLDTAGRRVDGIDLRDVDVLAWQQADDEPALAYRRRDWFSQITAAAGAQTPRYVPLTMRVIP